MGTEDEQLEGSLRFRVKEPYVHRFPYEGQTALEQAQDVVDYIYTRKEETSSFDVEILLPKRPPEKDPMYLRARIAQSGLTRELVYAHGWENGNIPGLLTGDLGFCEDSRHYLVGWITASLLLVREYATHVRIDVHPGWYQDDAPLSELLEAYGLKAIKHPNWRR